jgi:hypothetical protein
LQENEFHIELVGKFEFSVEGLAGSKDADFDFLHQVAIGGS